MTSGPITSWQIEGGKQKQWQTFFSWTTDGDCSHEIKIYLLFRRKAMTNLDSILKKRVIILLKKGPYSQNYGFSSNQIWMWELDHKEGWALKNWCFQIVVLEKILERSLNSKENQPINLKENQPWIFIGSTGAEPEAPILGPPDSKRNWLIGKHPDPGKDWKQKEKGEGEDKTVRLHHWLNGCGSEQTPGVSGGQRSLACYSPWGHKESDTTQWLNNNNSNLDVYANLSFSNL